MTTAKKPTSSFTDLDAIDIIAAADKGAEIAILHPSTKEPTGIFISVLGKDSQVFRDYVNDEVNEQVRKAAVSQGRKKKPVVVTAEQGKERAVELLTLLTTGWRSESYDEKGNVVENKPIVMLKGEELSFSVANVKRVYSESLTIFQQIDIGVGEIENFMPI